MLQGCLGLYASLFCPQLLHQGYLHRQPIVQMQVMLSMLCVLGAMRQTQPTWGVCANGKSAVHTIHEVT